MSEERWELFRKQWPADTPWCEAHWRPRMVCFHLGDTDGCTPEGEGTS